MKCLRISRIKLDQLGFDHVFLAIGTFVIVGVVGTAMIVASHAATTTQWTGRLEVYNNNSGYCLTTPSGSEGAYAQLDPCTSTYNADQVWSVVDTGTFKSLSAGNLQEFNVKSAAASDECLNDWQNNHSINWQMRLYPCSSTGANTWIWGVQGVIANISTHQLLNMSTQANMLCLSDYQGSHAAKTAVDLSTCKTTTAGGQANQEWFEDSVPAKTTTGSTWTGALQNGITSAKLCMNDNNSSTSNGTPIGIYTCENVTSEKWTIAKNSSGQFLLKNGQGVCADDTGDGVGTTPVQTYACSGSDHAQLWEWSGKQIENVYSKGCINDPSSSTKNGTQLHVASCSGDPASEQWSEVAL